MTGDSDEFDELCRHLAVFHDGEVVGTYRMLLRGRSSRLYSEREFALGTLAPVRPGLVEVGVHPEHRTGAVVNLMWSVMGRYALAEGYHHLAGCASVSLADGGESAGATWGLVRGRHFAPPELRVIPHRPWLARPRSGQRRGRPKLPPLLRRHLRLGAGLRAARLRPGLRGRRLLRGAVLRPARRPLPALRLRRPQTNSWVVYSPCTPRCVTHARPLVTTIPGSTTVGGGRGAGGLAEPAHGASAGPGLLAVAVADRLRDRGAGRGPAVHAE
jgi:Acetyltransferase (GNAT) domain